MNKINKIILLIFTLLNSFFLFSQVTYTNYEKKQEELVNKPAPYDSLQNWNISSTKSINKKYIGQRVYLPKNRQKEKYINKRIIPFIFSKNKRTIILDSVRVSRKYTNDNKWSSAELSSNIYKPMSYTYGPYTESNFFTNSNKAEDKYFVITNVLYGNKVKDLDLSTTWYVKKFKKNSWTQKLTKKEIKPEKSDFKESKYKFDLVFELKDDETNEIFYYAQKDLNPEYAKLILVSYFVKQKEIYEGENLVSKEVYQEIKQNDLVRTNKTENRNGNLVKVPKTVKIESKSIWKCIDVTILPGNSFISYILRNDKNETISINGYTGGTNGNRRRKKIDSWKFEKDILADEKSREEQKQKKEQEQILVERNREKECITKYGNELGEFIASRKLKIGMTKDMCKMSWGNPFWTNKTTTSKGTSESWYYGFLYSLHFEGNILKRIEE